jgi:hypothetical protein
LNSQGYHESTWINNIAKFLGSCKLYACLHIKISPLLAEVRSADTRPDDTECEVDTNRLSEAAVSLSCYVPRSPCD